MVDFEKAHVSFLTLGLEPQLQLCAIANKCLVNNEIVLIKAHPYVFLDNLRLKAELDPKVMSLQLQLCF